MLTIDERATALEMVAMVNAEDHGVAAAVERCIGDMARVAESVAASLAAGGRLVYVGCGTSGRIAAADAAECLPTFGMGPDRVAAIVGGGCAALMRSVEGAEDSAENGAAEVDKAQLGPRDVVIGVTASGATPFVLGALARAHAAGSHTVLVSCGSAPPEGTFMGCLINVQVGPEVVQGSTRMKAGTAQKMVLNTISTVAMARLGRVYQGRMVWVQPTNAKLRRRAVEMVEELSGLDELAAAALLADCGHNPAQAILSAKAGTSPAQAREALSAHGGNLRAALASPAGAADGRR